MIGQSNLVSPNVTTGLTFGSAPLTVIVNILPPLDPDLGTTSTTLGNI